MCKCAVVKVDTVFRVIACVFAISMILDRGNSKNT